MNLKDVATITLAIYGAGLSTYNLIQAHRREQKRIHVTMSTAMYTYGSHLGPAMLSIQVVNAGTRPVVVDAPTLRLPDGRNMFLMGADGLSDFPKALADGGSGSVRIGYGEIARSLAGAGYGGSVEITPVCKESTGKMFAGKPWTVNVQEWSGM